MDRITEEIAHFIGTLHLTAEHAILREAYQDFMARKAQFSDPEVSPLGNAPFEAAYELLGFDPEVPYRSPAPDMHHGSPWHFPTFKLSFSPMDMKAFELPTGFQWRMPDSVSVSVTRFEPPELEPPGSVVTYANQTIFLSDDDYFGVGGHGLKFAPAAIDNTALLAAAKDAYSLSPIGNLEKPGSSAEIIKVIKTAGEALDGFTADPAGSFHVSVHQAERLDGIYVNGERVDEAPSLEDYYKFEGKEQKEPGSEVGKTGNAVIGEDGSIIVEASVTLTAGGNTLVNEAILKNFWTAAKVTAVVGDHYEINAIVQINAVWDTDSVSAGLCDWSSDAAVNQVLNIAGFDRQDISSNDAADVKDAGFPQFWAVTRIDGDLVMMNWIEQFIFQSDNDVGILSSSGATTSVIAGGNLGVNQVSIFELGFSYDLIIVGGSVYDANIIHQVNVLFDNDVVGALPGFQTNGSGSVSTSGNLLWNEAHITDIGGADRFAALPDAYLKAARSFADGGNSLSKGVLTDEAFAGLQGLRVLYVKGDLLSLQYIKQTSILGDSDQIALAMDALKPHLDADWTLSTGNNALINNAAIYDLDSFGKTYVGGQKYSQETLIQAELISSQPDHLGAQNPDALVSEAVLFLDSSMLDSPGEAATAVYVPSAHDAPTDDGLQHMLGH